MTGTNAPQPSNPRGILLVVSAPSGTGKTTLCHRLLDEFEGISFSVSYTTRPLRGGEQDGVDYHFVDGSTFDQMVQQDQLAEWAHVFGNRYGTARATVEQHLAAGEDLIFDIDYQGGNQLIERYAETVAVFVLPPSLAELERRLRSRGTDSEEAVSRRLRDGLQEIEHFQDYHYLVVNDDLDRAYDDLRAIYRGHQLRRQRQEHVARRLLDQARGLRA